jgi:hypothetical protein
MNELFTNNKDLPPADIKSIDELFFNSLKFKGSVAYKKFFEFIARFNHYSRYNSMLVYIQNPAITFFGSASYWKKNFKRVIKPNARSMIILAPKGPVIIAYDVMDTTGELPAEDFLHHGLGIELYKVGGDFKESYLESLKIFCNEYGFKVITKPLNFFNAGAVTTYITKKFEIYLREGHQNSQHFATLCHELAHIFLGHTGHKQLLSSSGKQNINLPQRMRLSKKVEELEAETVSYLVCTKLGLETQSLEYLAGYLTSEKDWKSFSYETVIKVADKLEGLINYYTP